MLSIPIVPEVLRSGGQSWTVFCHKTTNRRRYRTGRNENSGDNSSRRRFGTRPALSTKRTRSRKYSMDTI